MSTLPPRARHAVSVLCEAHLTAFGTTYLRARRRRVPPRSAYALGCVVALFLAPAPTMRGPRRQWACACEEEVAVRRARDVLD